MRDTSQRQILAAGAVAAFTVDLLVYPLDTIKTRYQNQGSISGMKQLSSVKQTPYQFTRGLYQGIGSVILATLPAAAIFFASYESATTLLKSALPTAAPDPAIHAIASAGAEMASCIVLTPAEVVKQNAQVLRQSGSHQPDRSSSLRALHMVWYSEGGVARTLRRGYAALVARNLPFTAIHFPTFEFFRKHLWKWRQDHWPGASSAFTPNSNYGSRPQRWMETKGRHNDLGPFLVETGVVTGSAAAGSGAIAALITTPADVVKTRVMLSRSPNGSALDVMGVILREGGIRGLFRGGALRSVWASLGSGLYLGSYEATKCWLKQRSS